MNFFRAARFSVERFMQDERFQEAYVGALTADNPILASSMLCGPLHQQLGRCQARHGRDGEQCAQELVNTLACAASVFAPEAFAAWRGCVEGDEGSEGCAEEMQAALAASERHYAQAVEDAPHRFAQEAATVEAIRRCGFPGDQSAQDEAGMNKVIECVAGAACPGPLKSYMDCVDRNEGDYSASACQVLGVSFARCFGSNMAESAMRVELDN